MVLRTPVGQVPPHGTAQRYNHHQCHCTPCSLAKRRRDKEIAMGRRRTVPVAPTARRLQALAWMGWGIPGLSSRVDIPIATLSAWREERQAQVSAIGAARVAALYEQLWNTRGPAVHTSNMARRKGWRAPMDWEGYIDMLVLPRGLHRDTSEG